MKGFAEARELTRPGVQSLVGLRRIARLQGELGFYFRQFEGILEQLGFVRIYGRFATGQEQPPPETRVEAARTLSLELLAAATTALRELLSAQLRPHLIAAFIEGVSASDETIESELLEQAAPPTPTGFPIDRLGPSGEQAVQFAEREAARLVVQIDETTRQRIAELVAQSLRELRGADWLARSIRSEIAEMARSRALKIARTEINNAMSEATIRRMEARNVEFKDIVLGPDPDPVCEKNKAACPLLLGRAFPSGQQRPPFHPNCVCALISSRGPAKA